MDTKITNEEFEDKIDEIFGYMKKVLLEKNKSYGSASFEGGKMALIGNMFRQKDKMNRYWNLMDQYINGGTMDAPFGESVWDTVCDIFGYSTIGLTILTLLGMEGENYEKFLISQGVKKEVSEQYKPFGSDGEEGLTKEEIELEKYLNR